MYRIEPTGLAAYGFIPTPIKVRSFFLREIRLPRSVDGPVRAQFIKSREKVHRQACSVSRTERRRLLDHRAHDLAIQNVGLELHQKFVRNHPPVDAERGERDA